MWRGGGLVTAAEKAVESAAVMAEGLGSREKGGGEGGQREGRGSGGSQGGKASGKAEGPAVSGFDTTGPSFVGSGSSRGEAVGEAVF